MKAFSKPAGPVTLARTAFVAQNDGLRAEALSLNRAYASGAPRRSCKTCGADVGAPDFMSFHVAYSVCAQCGHLNGLYDDATLLRAAQDRPEDPGQRAAMLQRFDARVEETYLPKLDFLTGCLAERGTNRPPRVLDVGCGGGHFVKACQLRDIPARGIDPKADLIALGREKLGPDSLAAISPDAFADQIRTTDASIVSMLDVLEYLPDPREALTAFRDSEASVLFVSVPLFSLSVFLEHCFPQVFPRQLSGAHTHLYTPESLACLERDFGLERFGEWWFGADMIDLYRSISVSLRGSGATRTVVRAFDARFGAIIDDLQAVLDQHQACSEVHLVWGKNA
ncbi:MAG: class I SAM-dependent methyltransferase [Alphaproteobacteria bacterium]